MFERTVRPDVVHNWPFVINDRPSRRWNSVHCIQRSSIILPPDTQASLANLFGRSMEQAKSERDWNKITMSPEKHRYWSQAYFCLENKGEVPPTFDEYDELTGETTSWATYRVQWHWLSSRIPESLQSHLTSQAPRLEGKRPLDCKRLVRLETDDGKTTLVESINQAFCTLSNIYPTGATARDQFGRRIETGRTFILKVKAQDLWRT